MIPKHPKVDRFLRQAEKWRAEMEKLREIALDAGLTEEFKWGKPCYSFEQNNIAIIQPFKHSCALMFFKGSLLKDPNRILESPGENSRIASRATFMNVEQIAGVEDILKAYIHEAVEVERTGLKVEPPSEPGPVPEELQKRFKERPDLKKAFESLTPGRRRAYILHFSAPKKPETRDSRVEKCIPRILEGKGLNDR